MKKQHHKSKIGLFSVLVFITIIGCSKCKDKEIFAPLPQPTGDPGVLNVSSIEVDGKCRLHFTLTNTADLTIGKLTIDIETGEDNNNDGQPDADKPWDDLLSVSSPPSWSPIMFGGSQYEDLGKGWWRIHWFRTGNGLRQGESITCFDFVVTKGKDDDRCVYFKWYRSGDAYGNFFVPPPTTADGDPARKEGPWPYHYKVCCD